MIARTKKKTDDSLWGWPVDRCDYKRFANLSEIIRENNCKILVEIGVCGGFHAKQMILTALETPGEVFYYGFDLFEDITDEIRELEASPRPLLEREVYERLKGSGVKVKLFKGYTKDTLSEFLKLNIKPDFVFIDGGHSYYTIENDWFYVRKMMKPETIVVFDDYMSAKDELGWGCHRVIDNYKGYSVEILEPHDSYYMKKAGSDKRVLTENRMVKVWTNTAKTTRTAPTAKK